MDFHLNQTAIFFLKNAPSGTGITIGISQKDSRFFSELTVFKEKTEKPFDGKIDIDRLEKRKKKEGS